MTSDTSPAHISLNWDDDAIWVQDRSMYLLEQGQNPDDDMLRVVDQLGKQATVARDTLLETHVPIMQATVFKSRYRPVQAFCPSADSLVEASGQSFTVQSGDALVRERDGTVRIMPRHDFNCRYQFVGAASDQPPVL